ncbi:MAG TPA: hypothetical protein VJQ82_24115 [Terriglobales bacterium]|nr:hypothetical protein [Terriglobales bacterium]
MRFWQNPEFMRHLRSQLRPARALAIAAVVVIVCVLVWMGCWGSQQAQLDAAHRWAAEHLPTQNPGYWAERVKYLEEHFVKNVALSCFEWLLGIQAIVLTFWSLAACTQSVLGERDRKTWDFQRVTRLTSGEIVIGKLLGEPVLAYFIFLCSLPASLIAGAAGGVSPTNLFAMYAVLIANALFLGLGGLWLSTMMEARSRGLFVIGALSLLAFSGLSIPFYESHFPGLAAFSPYMEIGSRLNGFSRSPSLSTLFGQEVSWATMSLLLYVTFGAWLALVLVRNIKRDHPDLRPFTRWQVLAFAAFLNFLIYGLFRSNTDLVDAPNVTTSLQLATYATTMNWIILFIVGLATLSPRERLKIWWRKRTSGHVGLLSDEGLPWPWIALSAAIAYLLMFWGLLAWRHALAFDSDSLKTASVMVFAIAVFVIRDILFLQWCILTRLRAPVMKGLMYLCLYYIGALIIGGLFFGYSEGSDEGVLMLFTPSGVFDSKVVGAHFPTMFYAGLAIQVGVIAVISLAISKRLSRAPVVPALATT